MDPFENKTKSGFKKPQRGLAAYNNSSIAITPVNPEKTFLRHLGATCSDSGGVPRTSSVTLAADGKSINHSVTFGASSGSTSWELVSWD